MLWFGSVDILGVNLYEFFRFIINCCLENGWWPRHARRTHVAKRQYLRSLIEIIDQVLIVENINQQFRRNLQLKRAVLELVIDLWEP